MHLITSKRNEKHVNSVDDRAYHAHSFGDGNYVLYGCDSYMTSPNNIHIEPGDLLFEGSIGRVEEGGEDIAVPNGTNGMSRVDLLVVRYTMDAEHDNIEDSQFVLLRGEAVASGEPVVPEHITGSALSGSLTVDYPYMELPIVGVNVGEPKLLFERTTQYVGHTHDASDITEGVLDPEHGGTGGVLPIEHGGHGATTAAGAANRLCVQSIGRGVVLDEGADLNDLKTVGNYVCQSGDAAKTLKNCPVQNAFRLTVWDLAGANGNSLTRAQELFVVGTFVRWRRTFVNDAWSEWSYDLSSGQSIPIGSGGTGGNTPTSAVNALKVKSLANGAQIGENANLNTYLTPGNYVCLPASRVETVTNKPSGLDASFRLYVYDVVGSDTPSAIVMQELISSATGRSYFRSYYNSTKTWTAWNTTRFIGDVVPVSGGGTGATNRGDAMDNLTGIGTNTITSTAADTLATWRDRGAGVAWFNQSILENQPYATGSLLNFPQPGLSVINQIFHAGTAGSWYGRGFDANGASAWRMFLDNANTAARVTKRGQDGKWYYQIYSDKFCHAIYLDQEVSRTCITPWGNGFYNTLKCGGAQYPAAIKWAAVPRVQTVVSSPDGRLFATHCSDKLNTTNAPSAYVCSFADYKATQTCRLIQVCEGWVEQ